MALDRQSIEKRDFPIGRRGYEPDAVDGHLAMLADEVEALKRSAARPARQDSVASAASEQVRLIVQAAEESAAEIEREAEEEAADIRRDAREAADHARSDAGAQAREHVEKVSTATSAMLERTDVLEAEFTSMLESVRATAARLSDELSTLQATVTDLRGSLPGGDLEPEPAPAPAPPPVEPQASSVPFQAPPTFAEPEPEPVPAVAAEPEPVEPAPAPAEAAGPAEAEEVEPAPLVEQPTTAPSAIESGDEEGARLIALNMALNGTPREETERYLGENFELADPAALLDDVYARAGQ